jgi:hypothetical protein
VSGLPRAPADALGPTGPRFGTYRGSLGRVDLTPLQPDGLLAQLRHATRVRRWYEVLLVTAGHAVVVAVEEAGALAEGTAWVADRATGEVLFDRAAGGVPGVTTRVGDRPGAGARASFVAPGMELRLERRSDRYQLAVEVGPALRLEARLDGSGAPDPYALVAPLPGDGLRAGQVSGALPTSGELVVRGTALPLAGALAVVDYGAGVYPREVAWRRATALGRLPDGRAVVLRLADGPGDQPVDDVLIGPGGPVRLPPVAFQAEEGSPTAPWRLASEDGAVELLFRPAASHRETRTLLLLEARTTQLAGRLSGRLPGPDGDPVEVEGLAALVEERAAR